MSLIIYRMICTRARARTHTERDRQSARARERENYCVHIYTVNY